MSGVLVGLVDCRVWTVTGEPSGLDTGGTPDSRVSTGRHLQNSC